MTMSGHGQVPATPASYSMPVSLHDEIPIIDDSESFDEVVKKLMSYIARAVDSAYTYEQLRTSAPGQSLKPLISSLSEDCHHSGIVAALLYESYSTSVNTATDAASGPPNGCLLQWKSTAQA